MPRLSKVRSNALRALVDQVRFAPPASLLRQAEHAEALAAEIEADRAYPEGWLVYRVTGFAPEGGGDGLLTGAQVLGDLSALVEALTARAEIEEGSEAACGPGVADLAARWGVTRRTIERFRREGLVARRVVSPNARGRARLVFSELAVRAFEARRGLRADESVGKPRMSDATRARCVAWAVRLAARSGCSLHAAAVRLSRREGVSVPTMRRLLRADAAPAFPSAGVLAERDCRFAWAALRAGASAAEIGERLGRSGATVLRAVNRHRAILLRSVFETGDDQQPDGPAHSGEAVWEPAWWPESWEGWLAAARSVKPFSADIERSLVRGLTRARAAAHATGLQDSGSAIDQAETALRIATACKARLLVAQSALVLRTVEGSGMAPGRGGESHGVLLRACVLSASEVMDRFGGEGRLAAPVSLALSRVLAAWRAGASRGSGRFPGFEELCPWERWLAMPPWVRRGVAHLDAAERTALAARWGDADRAPMSLSEIRSVFGVSPVGWAAIYRRACRLGRSA